MRSARTVILALVALAATACASGDRTLARLKPGEEMKAGYQAARHWYWQEALMRFEAANRAKPAQPHVLNNLAVALEATGRYDEARTAYEQAADLAPGDRHIKRNLERFKDFYDSFVARSEEQKEAGGAAGTGGERKDGAQAHD